MVRFWAAPHIFVEFFVKGNGRYHMPVTKMAAPDCLGAWWQRGIGPVYICPFNLELKFLTSISLSYLIQIGWFLFLNFSKITLFLLITFLMPEYI